MEKLLHTLVINIQAVRTKKRLSQKDLFERCGLDRTYIGKIHGGERAPFLGIFSKIAKTIEIHPFELLQPQELTRKIKKFK